MQNATDGAGYMPGGQRPEADGKQQDYQLVRRLEAEHRYRNTLAMLAALARLRLREANGAEARESMIYMLEAIDTLSKLQEFGGAGGGDGIAAKLTSMARQWQRLCNGGIRIVVKAEDPDELPSQQQTIAVLIAQELVLNAIKHAFPGGRSGLIRIWFARTGRNHVTLVVEDDGVGAAMTAATNGNVQSSAKPHGTTLLQSLSGALGGNVERDSGESGRGHRVCVTWPLKKGDT